jgi:cold shock CspA family protein
MTDYTTGHIVKLIPERGFGFIRSHVEGIDYFFLAKDVRLAAYDGRFDRLAVGHRVTFVAGQNGPGRPRAFMVQVIAEQQDAA